jgi:hypothetical protein
MRNKRESRKRVDFVPAGVTGVIRIRHMNGQEASRGRTAL